MAGYDEKSGPALYYMDYLASMNKLPFAVHGYGSFFSLSIFDRYYKPDLTQDEAYELINKCVQEVSRCQSLLVDYIPNIKREVNQAIS